MENTCLGKLERKVDVNTNFASAVHLDRKSELNVSDTLLSERRCHRIARSSESNVEFRQKKTEVVCLYSH